LFFFSFFPLNSHSKTSQSTLLKILACNVSGGEVHGSIYVNGSPIVAREFRAASAVVWQRDILLPTATVREAIMTSAELKLPQRMAWEEKRRRVDQIVQELVR
jgi:ABC-type multidrug transport system ATPase subunit